MSCFTELVDSRFLGNIKTELKAAQKILKYRSIVVSNNIGISCDRDYNKAIYDYYIAMFDCEQDFESIADNKDVVSYIQDEHIILMFSGSKRLVDQAIRYTHNVNGDIPFYRTRHHVRNTYVYTAMIDTRFVIPPASTN